MAPSTKGRPEEEEKKKLTLLVANREIPEYFDYAFLHPCIFAFFGFLGFFGLPSIGNPMLTNWELDGDVATTMSLKMVGHRRRHRPFGTHLLSAPYLPVELWDMIVEEFILPSCLPNAVLNFEPLRVNSQFIDIVQGLNGHIFTGGEYQDLFLSAVNVPFNREFYIGQADLHSSPEEIFFLDDSSIDTGHTQYLLKYKNYPNWVPGDVRLVLLSDNGDCYVGGRYLGL